MRNTLTKAEFGDQKCQDDASGDRIRQGGKDSIPAADGDSG